MKTNPIDINLTILNDFVESLRPESLEIRDQLDFGYSYDGSIVYIYEIRPDWSDKTKKESFNFVKIRYYKTRKEWYLYWMRASGKWELYKPFSTSPHLAKILKVISEDKYGCFFG